MSDPLKQRVRAFILSNFMVAPEDAAFTDADSLLGLGVIDSMGVMEISGFIKKEFGVAASVGEIRPENFDSIEAISGFVHRKRGS